ncbi:MAG: box helicase domain protein [Clostridia bacterium]|nr:box helicase domain protein [Clostridia bacterium]
MNKLNFDAFGLSEETMKALFKLRYENPTEVQARVIPAVLKKQDIIVKSQTGSGKTAAFAIPICENLELEQKNPQVLVLTPTRELAVQVKEDFSHVGRFKRIRCAAIFGKQPMEIQKRELKQRVHVVVGTPGRTSDHIEKKNLILDDIKYLVIDEADKMLDMGFIDQVEAIVSLLPRKRVTMLFSATMPDKIEEICNKYMINPQKIELHAKNPTVEKIQQWYYEVEESRKFNALKSIIYTEKPDSCILFCNTREKVQDLLDQMDNEGYYCAGLHGGMEQDNRLYTMQRFKRGEFHFLIATDVAARGLHIDDVSHVVNYDVPMENESYVHRIGRTGRAGKEGVAITLSTKRELRFLNEIEEYIQYSIPKKELPTEQEVVQGREEFEESIKSKPKAKADKAERLNREITKIRINSGKKNKMRPGDILGAITSIEGITADDIGIIDVQDTCSYVEVFGRAGETVARRLPEIKIKGKLQTVKKVRIRTM